MLRQAGESCVDRKAKKNIDKSKMFVILREIGCRQDFLTMIFIGRPPHFICYKTGDRAWPENGIRFSVTVFLADCSENSPKTLASTRRQFIDF